MRDFLSGVLWYTADPSTSAGAALSKTDVFESGGLPVAQRPLPADAVTHVYVLELSSAGQPLAKALPLRLAAPEVRQTDPSLSPDGCALLFSAQEPDGLLRLFHARRVRSARLDKGNGSRRT